MNPMEALMLPISDEDKMRMMAESLRGRKNAADFFALSSIKSIADNAKAEQQYVSDVATRQGVLKEALERRKQEQKQFEDQKAFMREQSDLNRKNYLLQAAMRGPSAYPQVNIDPAAEKYYEARGKADSDAFDKIYTSAEAAQNLNNNLDAFAAVMDGVQTGMLSGVQADLSRLGASLGMEIDPNADSMQAARAISNQLALQVRNPDSGMGMPGAVSNRDISFLTQAMPRIVNTPGGNALIVETLGRLNKRQIERAQMATEFESRNGRFNKAMFEREWKEYIETNPLFEDLAENMIAAPQATMPQDNGGWTPDEQSELEMLEARANGSQR